MSLKCIGIDIGGTSVKLGIFEEDGTLVKKWEIPTRKEENGKYILGDIAASIRRMAKESGLELSDFSGAGMGFPGPVLPNGHCEVCVNLGWKAGNPQQELSRLLDGMVVKSGNDANVAALGEMWQGGGKGYKNLVMVTLGTGVGGGIIINGKVYSGSNFAGGEIGHTVIVVDGRPCTCGRHGCWETYASATGLIKTTKEHMKDAPKDSPIWTIVDGDESKVNGRTAFDAMRAGDPVGKAVVDEYIKYLSVGLTDMINIFQPAILCIGGGICNEGETLLAPVRAFIDREQYAMNSTKKTKVCKAQLGNDAGIIGAALLGKQED